MTTLVDILSSAWQQFLYLDFILQLGVPAIITSFLVLEYSISRVSEENSSRLTTGSYTLGLIFSFLSPGSIHFNHSSTRHATIISSVLLFLLVYKFADPYSEANLFLLVLRIYALLDISRVTTSKTFKNRSWRELQTPVFVFISLSFIVVIIFTITNYLRERTLILEVENDIFVAFLQVIAILVGFLVVMSFYYTGTFRELRTKSANNPSVQSEIGYTNRLFSLTFMIFFIGIIFSIIGIVINSQEIIQSKTDTLVRSLPMLFFFLDSAFVIIGLVIVYSLWGSYRKL